MNTKRLLSASLIASTGFALSMLFGCGGSENVDSYSSAPLTAEQNAEKNESVKKIFYSIPAPQEMSGLLKRSGATFNKELMNNLERNANYSTVNSRALNLGVFGADLSYATIFDNTQEALQYLSVAKAMADGLGITNAFNPEVVDRIEANIDNRDSMLLIISSSYLNTDEYLQENGRGNVSALIIAGGWVETTYLATQTERLLAANKMNEELKIRIAEQKYSLENLLNFLGVYDGDVVIDLLASDLRKVMDIYQNVQISQEAAEANTDTANNRTVIGGTATVNISDEQLTQITQLVAETREKIIRMN